MRIFACHFTACNPRNTRSLGILPQPPKRAPASTRQRIFDGAAEAKLLALACSKPPEGRARWTLSLLGDKVVELNIVLRASDNKIGRTLKKFAQTPSETAICHCAGHQRRVRGDHGGRAGGP
jgi:hypothetical protein